MIMNKTQGPQAVEFAEAPVVPAATGWTALEPARTERGEHPCSASKTPTTPTMPEASDDFFNFTPEEIAAFANSVLPPPSPDKNGGFSSPAEGAKFMAGLGIPQIPLSAPTDARFPNPGKNPAINGTGWQDKATLNPAQIDAWAAQFPGCNFGSLARPDGFWVFEADSREVYARRKKKTKSGFTRTLAILSGSGRAWHLWYRQSPDTLAMGNVSQTAENKLSCRVSGEQCVSPGSIHASGKQYRVTTNMAPSAASAEDIAWLKTQRGPTDAAGKTVRPDGWMDQSILEGARDNTLTQIAGKLRYEGLDAEEIYAVLSVKNRTQCVGKDGVTPYPLDDADIRRISNSVARYKTGDEKLLANTPRIGGKSAEETFYERKLAEAQAKNPKTAAAATVVTVDADGIAPDLIDSTQKRARPVFPQWVMTGTSIYDGLVKPICDVNSRYPEFIFMPAMVHLLNTIALRIWPVYRYLIPTVFLGLISPYGRFFKSSSCEDAFDYFKRMGLSTMASSQLQNSDGQTLISSPGSIEGFGREMSRVAANRAILYYDELGRFVNKAGIDGSTLTQSLLTMYESGLFQNLIKRKSESFSFAAKSYCFSWIWCTTDDAFPKYWARLGGISSGLNDRMFFLLSPTEERPLKPRVDVDVSTGAALTKVRIEAAAGIGSLPIDYDALKHYSRGVVDPRSMVLLEKFALGFAVDLGLNELDADCFERARALVDYRKQAIDHLPIFEADNMQAEVQQAMVAMLQQHGGKMRYRDWSRRLNLSRKGTWVASTCERGLVESGRIRVGREKPKMIYLLKEDD